MKNLFLVILLAVSLVSCEKGSIQQTTDNLKRADSLFTKANDGIKTLDSISKTINDSNGIAKKVILPEIQKQKKSIDSTIKSGGWKIDSINKQIEKITKNVVVGTEVVKTLDSANNALQNGENALKVLTQTAGKILNQTKKQTQTAEPSANNSVSQESARTQQAEPIERNPLVKNATLEIKVSDLNSAKALLKQRIRENNADLVTENFSQNEGIQREFITVKVPLQHFDGLVNNVTNGIGEVNVKNTESEGKDYNASQMCDIEITLVQNESLADSAVTATDAAEEDNSFSGAFMKGFKVLGDALLFLLPFWPVFLIAAGIWYFVNRNKRKKEQQELERQQILSQQSNAAYPVENQTSTAEAAIEKNTDPDEPDYSKYLPKN